MPENLPPLTGSLPQRPATPERHIFRVSSDGNAEATGATAPPEPSRAIAELGARSRPRSSRPPVV